MTVRRGQLQSGDGQGERKAGTMSGGEDELPWDSDELDGGGMVWAGAPGEADRGESLLARVEARQELEDFKQGSTLYRATAPLQGWWNAIFPDSIDWELGWSLHLKALGRVSNVEAAAGAPVPGVFSRLPARKVDYLLGLAREALEAREFDRARELVADAKIEVSTLPPADESRGEAQALSRQIEEAALDSDFPY